MAEVDITNIKKSAYTNFLVNGVTRFLGMRNLTWEELKDYGIDKGKVSQVTYQNGTKNSGWTDDQKKKAARIGEYLLAKHDGSKEGAGQELLQLTTFETGSGKNKKTVKGKTSLKQLSGKALDDTVVGRPVIRA